MKKFFKNLISHDNKNTFNIIKSELDKTHYFYKWKIINASEVSGIPQHRERIYIVGFKNRDHYEKFDFEFPKCQKNNISEYLEKNIPEKYYYNHESKIWEKLEKHVVKKFTIYQYRRYYVRENKNNECPTLTANMGLGGHNVPILMDNIGVRKLTPRESFNLQGFPETYILPQLSDSHLYKLAGNSVSIPVITGIARKIVEILY